MKRVLANGIIFIIAMSSSFSQTDFRQGYIVKNNGDTLHGYINYQKESVNYYICNFKRFEIAFPVNYKPEQLKAYGINEGRQYYSAMIDEKALFLEYLVKGRISLLYVKKGSQRYFILGTEGKIRELKTEETVDTVTNQQYSTFKKLLKVEMSPYAMDEPINISKLEVNSLVSLFREYNQLANVTFEVTQRPEEKSLLKDYSILGSNKVRIGLIAGMSVFNYKVTSALGYIGEANFKPVYSSIIGLNVKGRFSQKNPHFFFKSEVLYQKVSIYGYSNYTDDQHSKNEYFNDIFIDYDMIKFRGCVNYGFDFFPLKILPHVGAAYSYFTKSSYYRFTEEYNSVLNIVQSYDYSDLKIVKGDISYFGGLTFEFGLSSARILCLDIDYELANQVLEQTQSENSNDINMKGSGSTICITVGLTL